MDQYLVVKTHVDENDNIRTQTKLYYKQIEAQIEFLSFIDDLKAKVSFFYSVPYDEFEIEDFGDIIQKNRSYEYKDFEGKHNVKIEMQII